MSKNLPKHVAIIMDGNRRWAHRRGLDVKKGHEAGSKRVLELAKTGKELGIEAVTIWGFSTENWKRSKSEVKYLINFLTKYAIKFRKEFLSYEIRFRHIGRKDRLPAKLLDIFLELEEKTRNYDRSTFAVALDYGGRDEVVRAVQQIVKDGVPASEISEDLISKYLDTSGMPEPDMIIRTGGEKRTSGFLPWQGTYAELFLVEDLFPDFSGEKLEELIAQYGKEKPYIWGGKLPEGSTIVPSCSTSYQLNSPTLSQSLIE